MKRTIDSLQKALVYQLQGLLDAETRLKKELSVCTQHVTSTELKAAIQRYFEEADPKLQKLDRIFSYLMQQPVRRKNEVILKMIKETHHLLNFTASAQLRNALFVGCIQNINAYKVASYKTTYLLTLELELDTATDLVQEILEWEMVASSNFATRSIHEFNKVNRSAKTE